MSERKIGKYVIECSHESKLYFPSSKITKGQLINYYERIAPYMLPHTKDRLMTLQRFPDGITKDGFYQKNTPDYFPDFIARKRVKKQSDGSVDYLICNNAATLVYIANQGMITPHIMLSKVDTLKYPDRIIFDLDPSSNTSFSAVIDTAYALQEKIESLGLTPFVMTTGSRGLHVVIPIKPTQTFTATKRWAKNIAQELVDEYPKILTLEVHIKKRKQKIFIDYLRNSYGATAVAPYAVRAIEKAPVAMPITWKDLSKLKSAQHYTITTIFRKISRSDPWASFFRKAKNVAVK